MVFWNLAKLTRQWNQSVWNKWEGDILHKEAVDTLKKNIVEFDVHEAYHMQVQLCVYITVVKNFLGIDIFNMKNTSTQKAITCG